jgi:hypothetical protein
MRFVQEGRVQLEVDAKRPGMHTHAERGHDQMPGSGSVGAGLLANAVGQNRKCRLPKPVRQQAGSYSFRVVPGLVGLALAGKAPSVTRRIQRVSRRACMGGTGFSREAFDQP